MQAVARTVSRRCIRAPAAVCPARAAGIRRGYCNDPLHREKLEEIGELLRSIDSLAGLDSLLIKGVFLAFGIFVADEAFHFFYDRRHHPPAESSRVK